MEGGNWKTRSGVKASSPRRRTQGPPEGGGLCIEERAGRRKIAEHYAVCTFYVVYRR